MGTAFVGVGKCGPSRGARECRVAVRRCPANHVLHLRDDVRKKSQDAGSAAVLMTCLATLYRVGVSIENLKFEFSNLKRIFQGATLSQVGFPRRGIVSQKRLFLVGRSRKCCGGGTGS